MSLHAALPIGKDVFEGHGRTPSEPSGKRCKRIEFMGSSSGGVTTVEDQLGTGHPLGRIGCQIQHRAGDVGRLAKATDRMGGLDRAFGRRVVGSETQIDAMLDDIGTHLGCDDRRMYRVDATAGYMKSVVQGMSVIVRVYLGGCRLIKQNN